MIHKRRKLKLVSTIGPPALSVARQIELDDGILLASTFSGGSRSAPRGVIVITKFPIATDRDVKHCPRQQTNQPRECNEWSKNQQIEHTYQISVSQRIREAVHIENAIVNKVSKVTDQVTQSAANRNHPD
jgi:hypothetical protein